MSPVVPGGAGPLDHDAVLARTRDALDTHEWCPGSFFLVRLLGLEFEYGEEDCRSTLPVDAFLNNPSGALHGGIVALVMDITMGHLCQHHAGRSVTVELRTQYQRPVRQGPVVTHARFLRAGRRLMQCEARMTDATGLLLATGNGTWVRAEA